MTFPRETAEQVRRRILEMCQDHIRRALDALREVCVMISAFPSGDENVVLQHFNSVVGHVERAWQIKREIMKEVAEVGELLTSRNDFINLSAGVSKIADYCGGAAYRMAEMSKRGWKIPVEIVKEVENLADSSLNCLIRLRDVILALSYGPTKVMEVVIGVESCEKTTDSIYRKVDLRIISSGMDLPALLLLREVAQFLEDVADTAEEVADIARIIALTT